MNRSTFLFVALVAASAAMASEDEVLRAIQDGEIKFSSEIVVPEAAPNGDGKNSAPAVPSGSSGGLLTEISAAQEAAITDRAFPLLISKWPFGVVFVCWEDFGQSTPQYRRLIREAVSETWEKHSALEFPGWTECSAGDRGLRIALKDEGPHVKALGKFIDGKMNGMVLNATYKNWGQGCQEKLNYCNRVIAIHEFGHAIGFAHEQNRPDTPGECLARKQRQGSDGDTLLTPWDPFSVMNYCNEVYSNDGVLSKFDIVAVQYIYGRK